MKTSFWMKFFCGIFLLPMISATKFDRNVTHAPLPLQHHNSLLANRTPVCLDRGNIPAEELYWLYMPNNSNELATNEDYGYLSGQLIQAGVVNASDCPLGGLWPDGYANACGLEKTRQVSLYLQNVYDDDILTAGKGIGVPPVMIKQLIRYESQFWPMQMGYYHFGLGHLTYAGASNAIMWNRDLYDAAYARSQTKTDLPTQLLSMMDPTCPTCQLKIDIPKAKQSITYLAETLLADCRQTSQIVFNATGSNAGDVVDYPTIWRLTLLNYNVGPLCVYDAIRSSYQYGSRLSWYAISSSVSTNYCSRGVTYADSITAPYYDFGTTP
jgi:hypothetical protein